MSRLLIIWGFLSCALLGCVEIKSPRVVYDDTKSDTLTIENVLEDTSKVLVAGMPIFLDSTNVLIHPIGWDNVYINKKARGGLSTSYGVSAKKGPVASSEVYDVYSNNIDFLAGEMVNLIFENIETGKQIILTDKIMIISRISYLREFAQQSNHHYLLYTVYDKDYNRDGKLDSEDMAAYYVCNLDGTNFTKITKDYHYFDASQLIFENGKYYFRTIEDVNKDGKFDKRDDFHYYYVDLKIGDFTPIEYFPIELMNLNVK